MDPAFHQVNFLNFKEKKNAINVRKFVNRYSICDRHFHLCIVFIDDVDR